MVVVVIPEVRTGGGYVSYYQASQAGARPAGVYVKDDVRIIPYLGYNNGTYGTAANLPPIPLEWIIAPLNVTEGQCPDAQQTQLAFGLTNLAVALLTLVFGCRPVVHRLSRGVLGKKGGRGVLWTWAVGLALQLLANVAASLLVVRSPGYEHLALANVFVLYAARPRISPLWTAFLRLAVDVKPKTGWEPEFVYADGYISTAIAELFLQLVAGVFVGVTWSRFPNEVIREYMAGSWKPLCAAPGIVLLGWVSMPIWKRHGFVYAWTSGEGFGRTLGVFLLPFPYLLVYLFAWFYWKRFLELPGSL